MSYTEIYAFGKDGNAYLYEEVQNAWRGGMAIWNHLESKYLPPYRPSYVPSYIPDDEVEAYCHYKPSRCSAMMDRDAMKEIWNLANEENVSDTDKIALMSTFDRVVVKKENLDTVIKAFNEFDGQTSLKEQAAILEKMKSDDDVIAVGWNQTSVNADTWANFGGDDEENDESIPYNINTDNKHWFMFTEETSGKEE